MFYVSTPTDRIRAVAREIQLAPTFTPALLSLVVNDACTRLPLLNKTGKAAWLDLLVKAGASTDAVLALIELELPTWRLRRLVYEDGEWYCSLSRHTSVPVELDDSADANHEILPLAVLSAFLEAQVRTYEEYTREFFAPSQAPSSSTGMA